MQNVQKILVPITSQAITTDAARQAVTEAAWLARRFHAGLILLRVVSSFDYPAGFLESGNAITAEDSHSPVIEEAQNDLDRAFLPELEGVAVTRLLLRGDPAHEIVETARHHGVSLIVMSTHGRGAVYRLLLGSITVKVLHESACPVWTGAHQDDDASGDAASSSSPSNAPNPADRHAFSLRRILCSVDLTPRSRHTISRAADLAAAVDAALTLVHVTASVTSYGPGGSLVDPERQRQLVGSATEEIAGLQRELGTKAAVVIESGDISLCLNRVATETKADVLVIGHSPGQSHLGDNGEGYGIIRDSCVPVLSV